MSLNNSFNYQDFSEIRVMNNSNTIMFDDKLDHQSCLVRLIVNRLGLLTTVINKRIVNMKKIFFGKLINKGNGVIGVDAIFADRIVNVLKRLINLYKSNIHFKMISLFYKWRNYKNLSKIENELKSELIKTSHKNSSNKIGILENKISEINQEYIELFNKIQIQKSNDEKLNQAIIENSEKEQSHKNKIAKILEEKSILEKRLDSKRNHINQISEEIKKQEIYLNELEESIKALKDQIIEKDNELNIYIKESNEMLDLFDKKTTEIVTTKEDEQEKPKSLFKITTLPSNLIIKNSSKIMLNKTSKTVNNSSRNSFSKNITSLIK